jgi:hypothetical protein
MPQFCSEEKSQMVKSHKCSKADRAHQSFELSRDYSLNTDVKQRVYSSLHRIPSATTLIIYYHLSLLILRNLLRFCNIAKQSKYFIKRCAILVHKGIQSVVFSFNM